jgi:hypothetical protein
VLLEFLARERDQFMLGRMIDYVVSDDVLRGQGSMLVDVVPEVGQPLVPAHNEHLGDAFERIADLAEEFVFRSHAACVLPREVQALVGRVLDHLFGAELQHLCGLVVDKGDMVMTPIFTGAAGTDGRQGLDFHQVHGTKHFILSGAHVA